MVRLPVAGTSHQVRMHWASPGGAERGLDGRLADSTEAPLAITVQRSPAGLPQAGERVDVDVLAPEGLFTFPARILRVDAASATLWADITGDVVRIQRRQFFRMRVVLPPLVARCLDGQGAPVREVRAQIQNLGGGGLCFECDQDLERGATVELALAIDGPQALVVRASVLESVVVAEGRVRVRAVFKALADRDRQHIVRFLFQQEVALRRPDRRRR